MIADNRWRNIDLETGESPDQSRWLIYYLIWARLIARRNWMQPITNIIPAIV